MNTPEWLKPGIYGAVIGAVFVGVVGLSWGGWVTNGTVNDRAMAMSRADVVASMVPVCLDMARSAPSRTDKLATIRAASTYQRRDALMTAGWATMPQTETLRKPALRNWNSEVMPFRANDVMAQNGSHRQTREPSIAPSAKTEIGACDAF